MENERHYFLVGLFVLGGVLAMFAFTIWLTATDDSKYQQYRIHFAESVSGLSNGSDVKFRGVKVGKRQKHHHRSKGFPPYPGRYSPPQIHPR